MTKGSTNIFKIINNIVPNIPKTKANIVNIATNINAKGASANAITTNKTLSPNIKNRIVMKTSTTLSKVNKSIILARIQ